MLLWRSLFFAASIASAAAYAQDLSNEAALRLNLDYQLSAPHGSVSSPLASQDSHTAIPTSEQLDARELARPRVVRGDGERFPRVSRDAPLDDASIAANRLAPLTAMLLLTLSALTLVLLLDLKRALSRMADQQAHADVPVACWPALSIVLKCKRHNTSPENMKRLHGGNYPQEKLQIILVDDDVEAPNWEASRTTEAKNIASAATIREAMRMAHGDLLIVVDDIPIDANWLRQCATAFFDAAIGALHCQQAHLASGGKLAGLIQLARYTDDTRPDQGTEPILLAGSKVFAVRRSALLSVGGWRPGMHGADIDLACRLVQNGWRLAKFTMDFSSHKAEKPRWEAHLAAATQSASSVSRALVHHTVQVLRHSGVRRTLALQVRLAPVLLPPALWLSSFVLSLLHYLIGNPQLACAGLAICAMAAFDVRGRPSSLVHAAIALRTRFDAQHAFMLPLALPASILVSFASLFAALGLMSRFCLVFKPRAQRSSRIAPSTL